MTTAGGRAATTTHRRTDHALWTETTGLSVGWCGGRTGSSRVSRSLRRSEEVLSPLRVTFFKMSIYARSGRLGLSGLSRCPRSPLLVSGPAVDRPVPDVLCRIGVGVSLVPARGALERLPGAVFTVPVLAGVTVPGGVPGVHHHQIGPGLEGLPLHFLGKGAEPALRQGLVEPVLRVRPRSARGPSP